MSERRARTGQPGRPLLDAEDYGLSMRISPRARRDEDNEGLRTLMIHRLSDTTKAVARLSLRGGHVSLLCENCTRWTQAPDDNFPTTWKCPECAREFEMEFAILEEVNE
jgi:hypothetical protein